MRMPLGLYRPGDTLLHRIPAGPKLGLVAVSSIAVVATKGWRAAVAALVIAVAVAAWARLDLLETVRRLRFLLLMLTVVGAFQTWLRTWEIAVSVAGDLLALMIVSLVFTATTRVADVLTAVERGLRPLRVVGVRPERVALAFSLVLSAIPRIFQIAAETRDAARARGLERSPRALLIPLVLRTVAHALATGDALTARGLGD